MRDATEPFTSSDAVGEYRFVDLRSNEGYKVVAESLPTKVQVFPKNQSVWSVFI